MIKSLALVRETLQSQRVTIVVEWEDGGLDEEVFLERFGGGWKEGQEEFDRAVVNCCARNKGRDDNQFFDRYRY